MDQQLAVGTRGPCTVGWLMEPVAKDMPCGILESDRVVGRDKAAGPWKGVGTNRDASWVIMAVRYWNMVLPTP